MTAVTDIDTVLAKVRDNTKRIAENAAQIDKLDEQSSAANASGDFETRDAFFAEMRALMADNEKLSNDSVSALRTATLHHIPPLGGMH